jgi:hypothetical protein
MYVRCKLLLTQDNNSVEVILDKITGAAFRDVASFWGKFASSDGNIPPERRQWLFALAKWELSLMDGGGPGVGMGGGGLSYGELASLPPSATLSRALMTSRGMKPSDSSGIGVGEVKNPSEISVRFRRGAMTWQLLAFQNPGSNAWNSP